MTNRHDLDNLFARLDALSVGFGPTFRDFQTQTDKYPPHNIIRLSDDVFHLELALAGFKKNEVNIEECQGVVTIHGDKKTDPESVYQHRGIANRSFSKSFRIAEYFEIDEASMEDGILNISFVRNIPEAAKPKTIAIK